MKKRLLSILLMCCMVLTLLPVTAFAEGSAEEALVCTCETACTAESIDADCSACGAEGASAENCGKYAAPVNGEESVTGTSAQALTNATINFPAPKAGDRIIEKIWEAAASGLNFASADRGLWKNGKLTELGPDNVYEEGSTYLLEFRFYAETPLTGLETVTCNGQPVTLLADETALNTAIRQYDGTSDTYYAYSTVMNFSTGGTTIENAGLLYLYAFIRIPKVLTTTEVSTADALRAAIEDGTDGIVKLTADFTISESLTISRSVTLDLNDHVLTIPGDEQFISVSGQNTILTLTDSAETKTERKFSINKDGAWVPDENGDQTVSGGVITGGKAGIDYYGALAVNGGVSIQNHGTLTVTGGTVNAPVLNRRGVIAGSGTFNGAVINEDKITGGTFNGPVANYTGYLKGDNEISGGIFYGTVANGYNYYNEAGEETGIEGKNSGLITGGTFYGKVTNAFYGKITGGSFYGKVDNREGTYSGYQYRGTLAGGTFYAGHPGTVADGCCTVTYKYPFEETYAIQIVKKGETATRPADPVRSDFTFDNWYAYPYPDRPTQEAYDFDIRVEDDMFLWGNWVNTFYGIHITDKGGNVYNVTDKNFTDVLGDGKVSYVPGYLEEGKALADFTAEDLNKMLRGETVEGIRLPKLTLNGASFKQLAVGNWGNDSMTRQLNLFLQLELMDDNTIAYDETYAGEGAVDSLNVLALCITGSGTLNVTAPAENGWGLSGDWSLYRQESGTVTIQAGDCGIGYDTWSSFSLMFHGGKLTIEAGNDPKDSSSGVINSWEKISFDISESTTFLLGDSAENCISLTAPYTIDSVRQELTDAYEEEKLTHSPWYLSLTSNYTVTFDTDGGSAVDTQTIPYGGQVTAPEAPTKSGCTFAGWELDGKAYDFTAPVTANMTLTARWTANSYTITFDTDGGSTIAPITQDYGTAIAAPEAPTKPGYTFAGWQPELPAAMPAENRTVTAQWTAKQYTIAYDLDGGTANGNPDSYTVESEEITLNAPARPGYTFTGWSGTGLTGENNLTVTIPKGSTGGRSYTAHWLYTGGPVYYLITASALTGGSISPDGSVSVRAGGSQSFTVTPDIGYVIADVKVDGESIGAVSAYTFEKLSGSHTIEARFAKQSAFADVPADSYYKDAVNWAVENGITSGTDAAHFSPDGICTRAQAVTFLWRAAGSPAPKSRTMTFADVPAGSYYYDAVLWAVENGITTGTSATAFSPDAACTRAQIVTFLYRAFGKAVGGDAGFRDTSPNAYYAEALRWAISSGVTTGTSAATFSPNAPCTRAQIVTFLWRSKK